MIKLTNKINSQTAFLILLAVLGLLVSSCANQRQISPSCTLPAGVNLDEALAHSREDLKHLECEVMFDNYYERLIEVAKRDPGLTNKRKFSDFLEWANSEGIIDKIQARDYYNRYFNTTFMSLPDDYNVCSSCSEKKQNTLTLRMEEELGQKEAGLLRACQDKNAYYLAADQYNSIMLLLDATCTACRN
jgi:hypothetical protein